MFEKDFKAGLKIIPPIIPTLGGIILMQPKHHLKQGLRKNEISSRKIFAKNPNFSNAAQINTMSSSIIRV